MKQMKQKFAKVEPAHAGALALWMQRQRGVDIAGTESFRQRCNDYGREPCGVLCRYYIKRNYNHHIRTPHHVAGLWTEDKLAAGRLLREMYKIETGSNALGFQGFIGVLNCFPPEARSVAAASMLTEVNVTRIGRISTRIDSAPGLLEMVRVSQFARVHELGLQILNDLTTAPQGCRENEVRTWVMAFASALNEIALLEPDVPSLNSWTTNAHRLLLNFQSRFKFVHRPSAEFLARLL